MAQQQVLEDEIPARASRRQHGREQQPEQFEHVLSIADPAAARGLAAAHPTRSAAVRDGDGAGHERIALRLVHSPEGVLRADARDLADNLAQLLHPVWFCQHRVDTTLGQSLDIDRGTRASR